MFPEDGKFLHVAFQYDTVYEVSGTSRQSRLSATAESCAKRSKLQSSERNAPEHAFHREFAMATVELLRVKISHRFHLVGPKVQARFNFPVSVASIISQCSSIMGPVVLVDKDCCEIMDDDSEKKCNSRGKFQYLLVHLLTKSVTVNLVACYFIFGAPVAKVRSVESLFPIAFC
jgi:hypothetical protein